MKRLAKPSHAMAGAASDVVRPRTELVAENALLRQQLIVARRRIKRPPLRDGDRILMVLLARFNGAWRDALHLVKPDTLLRWHRDLFKLVWRRKSRSRGNQPRRLDEEVVDLIRTSALPCALGSRADTRRASQTRDSGQQAHDPEVHESGSASQTARPDLEGIPEEPRGRHLGLRLPPTARRALPAHLRVLHRQARQRGRSCMWA